MEFFGVDIAQDEFEVQGPKGIVTVKNDRRAIKDWVKTTTKGAVIALESTGGYGMALAEIAHQCARTVYVIAPRQIAAHRRSLGRRAKTDKMDARLIRDFIQSNHEKLHPFEPWAEPWKSLRDTVRLRTRLARDRARIALRMRSFVKSPKEVAAVTRGIQKYIRELDKNIQSQLAQVPESSAVSSPKGIGPLTAAASIAALKQVPFKDKDAFVAYMGLDLIVSDSGKHKSKRGISSWGDVTLRNLYYLAGKSAACRPEWQPYVQQLQARGMKPIQVHCALARKLARIVFALYHSGDQFEPERVHEAKPRAHPMLALQA